MKGAVAYVRVSSRGQDLGMQRTAIEKAEAARGNRIAAWYFEKRSAKTIDRAELARLRADVRAGRLAGQRIFVFRLDRLARTGIRDMFEVVEELRAHGCELTTVADGFDLNGPAAEVVLAVLAWAAKMENQARSERVAAARDRLEAEGRAWAARPSHGDPARAHPGAEEGRKSIGRSPCRRRCRARPSRERCPERSWKSEHPPLWVGGMQGLSQL